MNLLLVVPLDKSQVKLRTAEDRSNVRLILQLLTVTTTNIVTWIPSNIIYLSSLYMSRYATDLILWTIVTVTPINSLINPVIFFVTDIKPILKSKLDNIKNRNMQEII